MASEREKWDKPKSGNSVKHIPKDAQVIMSILKELGISEYEPRVINQLLEFTYRYVTCILDDAKIYANHAKKKTIDLDDVKLATQMTLEKAFTGPPPRDVLFELSRGKNVTALPLIKSHCGLRLPPDRHCLVAANYKLRAAEVQPKKMTKTALDRANAKAAKITGTALKRPSNVPIPKTQTVSIPKPVFKFSGNATTKVPTVVASPTPTIAPSPVSVVNIKTEPIGRSSPLMQTMNIKMEVDDEYSSGGHSDSLKRKREEDDDFEAVE